jgi:hypothetical protein
MRDMPTRVKKISEGGRGIEKTFFLIKIYFFTCFKKANTSSTHEHSLNISSS